MSLTPCNFILSEGGRVLSYDEARQYLLDNPGVWKKSTIDSLIDQADRLIEENKRKRGGALQSVVSPGAAYDALLSAYRAVLLAAKAAGKVLTRAQAMLEARKQIEGKFDAADIDKAEAFLSEKMGAVPPKPPVEVKTEEAEAPEFKKSRVAQRAVEGGNEDAFTDAMEQIGYLYEVESVKKAGDAVKKLFEEFGPDEILQGIRDGRIKGAAASRAWIKVIDLVNEQFLNAQTKEEAEAALEKNLQLTKEISLMGTAAGQFIKGFQDAYLESDFKFDVASMTNALSEAAGGKLSAEMQAKIKDWAQQISDLTKRLSEVEAEKKALEERQILEAYVEERPKDNRPTAIREAAKATAARIRKLKSSRPNYLLSSNPAVVAWDTAIELVATSVEAGGKLADAVQKGLKSLKESDWYKSASKKIQAQVEADFIAQTSENATPVPEFIDGKVKVSPSTIAALVKEGYDTIDKVVDKVAEMLNNPDLTKRQIRDAITGYGKTINVTKDEIQLKIQEIKRIGQKISQIEDARKKLRPLRSGRQRAKMVEEERRLQKELNQLLKEIPPTDADLTKQLKTALDAIKSRLKNQIEDLTTQIERKERQIKVKTSVALDAEAKELKEQRDALSQALDDLVGKQGVSDEQRIQNAVQALEKSIQEYERRIAEKDFSVPGQKQGPENEQIRQLREQRDKIKAEYEALKNGPPKTPEQLRLERLQKQLDDLLAGVVKDAKDKTPDSPEVKQLKDAIAKQKQLMGLTPGKQTDAQRAYETALKAAKKKLEDLEGRIERNELEIAKAREKQFGPAIDAIRARTKDAQKVLDDLRKEAGIYEQQKLNAYKKAAEKSIEYYRDRLNKGDFSPKPKSDAAKLDAEAKELLRRKIRAKEQYMKALAEYKQEQEATWKKILSIGASSLRLLLATSEFSFITIQNGMVASGMLFRDPVRLKQAFVDMFKAIASHGYSEGLVEDIKSQDWYPEMKASGLTVIDDLTTEAQRDETANFSVAQHIWRMLEWPVRLMTFGDVPFRTKEDIAHEIYGPANPIEAFERAANAFGNSMRVAEFLRGRQILLEKGITFEDNPKAYKEMAAGINTMTARTNLGRAESIVKYLNFGLFSARNWASVLKNLPPISFFYYGSKIEGADMKTVVTPERTFKFRGKEFNIPSQVLTVPVGPSPIQKMYVQNFMSYFALTAGNIGLFAFYQAMNEPEDEEEKEKYKGPKVEFDPRSAAAFKVQLGNQFYDPWGGKQQQVVLMSRIFTDILIDQGYALEGSYKSMSTGRMSRLGENGFIPSKGELIQNMIRNKLSPAAGLGYDWAFSTLDKETGERELNGRQVDLQEQFYSSFKPIYWETIRETAEEQPALTAAFLDAMGFIGHSVNTIKPKEKTPLQKARELFRPEEASQKRAKEIFNAAVEMRDAAGMREGLEKLMAAYETPIEKYKAAKEQVEAATQEKEVMGKIGIKQSDFDEFLRVLENESVMSFGRKAVRIERMRQIAKDPAIVAELRSKLETEYQNAKTVLDMMNQMGVKSPRTGQPMEFKKPDWMKKYERIILDQR